jgi:hypothetical protein
MVDGSHDVALCSDVVHQIILFDSALAHGLHGVHLSSRFVQRLVYLPEAAFA